MISKVIDFGLSKQHTEVGGGGGSGVMMMQTQVGSVAYMAPEVVGCGGSSSSTYGAQCDAWSLGVIAFILVSGYQPFGTGDAATARAIKAGSFEFDKDVEKNVSANCKAFIRSLLVVDPAQRSTIDGALDHPWLARGGATDQLLDAGLFTHLREFRAGGRFKTLALSVLANTMTPAEMSELASTFAALDTDGSGCLSMDELREGLLVTGKKNSLIGPAMVQGESELRQIMAELDADGSGEVDYAEFTQAMLTQRRFLQQDRLRAAFASLDPGSTGSVTASTLMSAEQDSQLVSKALSLQPGQALSMPEMELLVREADVDSNGQVDFSEFVRALSLRIPDLN